jgi:hypothetical protein
MRATMTRFQSNFLVHPSSTKVDRFLLLLNSSGIARCSEILAACADFHTDQYDESAIDDLCGHLVAKQFLTKWQCEKLRAGKWKGFWLDNYRLLSELKRTEKDRTYLAEEYPSGRRVAIVVTPPPRQDGQVDYRVEELS